MHHTRDFERRTDDFALERIYIIETHPDTARIHRSERPLPEPQLAANTVPISSIKVKLSVRDFVLQLLRYGKSSRRAGGGPAERRKWLKRHSDASATNLEWSFNRGRNYHHGTWFERRRDGAL